VKPRITNHSKHKESEKSSGIKKKSRQRRQNQQTQRVDPSGIVNSRSQKGSSGTSSSLSVDSRQSSFTEDPGTAELLSGSFSSSFTSSPSFARLNVVGAVTLEREAQRRAVVRGEVGSKLDSRATVQASLRQMAKRGVPAGRVPGVGVPVTRTRGALGDSDGLQGGTVSGMGPPGIAPVTELGVAPRKKTRMRRKRSIIPASIKWADRRVAWRAGGAAPGAMLETDNPSLEDQIKKTEKKKNSKSLTVEQEKKLTMHAQELIEIEKTKAAIEEQRTKTEIVDSAMLGASAGMAEPPSLDRQLAHAMLLSVDELARRIERGQLARESLVQGNIGLVVSIARKYSNASRQDGLTLEDLIQEGTFGLMKASERFEPSRGYRFSTYAYQWVQQSITRALKSQSRTIRLPLYLHDLQAQIRRASESLAGPTGAPPSDVQLAAHLGIKEQRLKDMRDWTRYPLSLDMVLNDGEDQLRVLGDTVECPVGRRSGGSGGSPGGPGGQVEEEVETELLRMDLEDLLNTLLPRERYILRMRYGLDDDKCKSIQQIAERLGVGAETVRRYEQRGINKLRHPQRSGFLRSHLPENAQENIGHVLQYSQ